MHPKKKKKKQQFFPAGPMIRRACPDTVSLHSTTQVMEGVAEALKSVSISNLSTRLQSISWIMARLPEQAICTCTYGRQEVYVTYINHTSMGSVFASQQMRNVFKDVEKKALTSILRTGLPVTQGHQRCLLLHKSCTSTGC